MRSSDIALAVLIAIVLTLSIASARLDSATSDEPAHIAAGMVKLTRGWLGFFREQPPLMNSLSAVPLAIAGYRIADGWQDAPDHWTAGRKFLYYSGNDAYRILFLARLPTILLFALLSIAMYVFVLQQTGSGWWALAAAVLTGFCPNLMAHGRLATVDFALTCFAFIATAALLRLIERPSATTALVFGITSAAAILSKVSGVILGPYFVVVIVAAFVFRKIEQPKAFWRAFAIAVIAGLVFFEGFVLAEMSPAYIASEYPHVPRIFVPFADYYWNVHTIQLWYGQGHGLPQFLFGKFSTRGWPHYYLVAFLLKTTIPAILLFIAAIVTGVRKKSFAFLALLAFVVLFMAVAAAGHLDLGIRYVLPIYPFVYALTAIGLKPRIEDRGPRTGWVVVALLLWHAGENIARYPSYIAYFNESIGSRANADKLLIDSNLDWGQDLRRLDLWCRKNKVSTITVHYFGGGDVSYEMKHARALALYSPPPGPLPKGYFALSRHFYRISGPLWGVDYDDYLAASHARYVRSIGGSINIYAVE